VSDAPARRSGSHDLRPHDRSAADASSGRSWTRWVPAVLGPVLLFVALVAWGLSSAPRSSPDDNFHLASIWCAPSVGSQWCRTVPDDPDVRLVPDGLVDLCQVAKPGVSAGCRSSGADESLSDDEYVVTSWANFNRLYPPVFYSAMAPFASDDLTTSVVLMRVANAGVFVLLVTAVAVAVPRTLRVPVILGVVAVLVPLGAFLVPSTNPTSWALLSGATLWAALLGHLSTTGRRSAVLGGLAVVAVVVGAGARADAAIFALLGVAVAAFLAPYRRLRWWHAVVPLLVVATAVTLYFSASQGSDGLEGAGDPQEPLTFQLVRENFREIPQLWAGILGARGLGWLDTPMPAATWVLAGSACAAVLWWGLGAATGRKTLAVLGLLAALWLVPLVLLVQARAVVPDFVQPRYLMPVLAILLGVAVLPGRHGWPSMSRLQAWVLVGALAVANAFALRTNILRHTLGLDEDPTNLDARLEWWWGPLPSPMRMWAIGSVAMLGALWAILVVVRRELATGPFTESVATSDGTQAPVADPPAPGSGGEESRSGELPVRALPDRSRS
jgi:Predicted membrane protein (DUF2142)